MRNQSNLLNSFLPEHEKEWDARLFIDDAIKTKVEYDLESIARALSGNAKIRLEYKPTHDSFFEHTEHIEADDKSWIKVTKKYKIEARMMEYVFYGNTKTDIWLRVIDFWAGKKTIFPCGGAGFIKIKEREEQQ